MLNKKQTKPNKKVQSHGKSRARSRGSCTTESTQKERWNSPKLVLPFSTASFTHGEY